MRFRVPSVLSFLALGLMLSAPISALAKDVQIAVVPVHLKPNPAFDGAVARFIDKPLRRQAQVLPPAQFRAAAKRAHVKPMAMALPRNLKTLGRAVHATHVLLIELSGKGRDSTVNSTLFDVATGRTVLTDSYPVGSPKLTAEVASQILAPVIDSIGGASGAADDSAATSDAGDEDAPKAATKKTKGKGFAFPGKGAAKDGTADEDDTAADTKADKGDDSGDEGDNAVEASAKPKHDANDPHATPLRLNIGATFMQRNAHLTPGSGTGTAPCYCGTGNNSNPFFPAPEFSGEFFPGVLKDGNADHWYDNIGLQADFFVTRVNSYVNTNPNNTIGSNVLNFSAALAYRLNWWDSPLAPDTYFHFGYSYFAFPLAAGAFPGVAYSAPYIGAELHVPILEQLTLMAGADYAFALSAGNDAATLLGTQSGGFGFGANGGARVTIDHFEITALYRYQFYDVSYTGSTSLTTRAGGSSTPLPVYNSVKLTDSLNEINLMVGYRF